jgi:GNAT superfamily N-acetyltransferase
MNPMSSTPNRPVPLDARHDCSGFSCGEPALDNFLFRYALANDRAGAAKTFVVIDGEGKVIAFYSLAAGQVEYTDAPERLKKGLSRNPIPILLLARLAVDTRWQKRGIGRSLVRDTIRKFVKASQLIGIRALVVQAKNEAAATFYRSIAFEPFPADPLRLALLWKVARSSL